FVCLIELNWLTNKSGRWGPYRQASPPPARHRPGARSARLGKCWWEYTADPPLKGIQFFKREVGHVSARLFDSHFWPRACATSNLATPVRAAAPPGAARRAGAAVRHGHAGSER